MITGKQISILSIILVQEISFPHLFNQLLLVHWFQKTIRMEDTRLQTCYHLEQWRTRSNTTTISRTRQLVMRQWESGTEFELQSTFSLHSPSLAPVTADWFGPILKCSANSSFLAATVFSRYLSALEPITCPRIDDAMVKAIADLGINTDFLSMAMNGTAAWTAANHEGENFSVCSLHIPKGTFAAIPKTPITSTFAGRGCGLRFLAKAVFARALLAATIAGGHLYFIPGGGWRAFATRGMTWLTARYDFAMGQLPIFNHSSLIASCSDLPPWK